MSNIRTLQECEKEILCAFVDVCNRYSLTYYLAYGTLLGAKRHKGFIPWDDDVDVAMPREDFELFVNEYYKNLPQDYRFRFYRTDKEYDSYVPRIENDSIKIKDASGAEYSAWIDIFPIDGMPPCKSISNIIHKLRLSCVRYRINLSRLQKGVDFSSFKRSKMERYAIILAKKMGIGSKVSTTKEFDKLDALLKKYNPMITNNSVNFLGEKFKDECPFSLYGKGRILDFEGCSMSVPIETEALLEKLYGDYMELPPEDKRNVHNIVEIRKVKK